MTEAIDSIETEIFKNRFQAIVDEMASLVLRSAHTVFIKETADFSAALVTPSGEVYAAPQMIGVPTIIGVPFDAAIESARDLGIQKGDIFVTNDVYGTNGMITHLPDIFLWKPVMVDGEVVSYVACFIHSSDIGGSVPGSIAPSNTEIYQEGIQIPVSKLFEAGELNEELLNIIRINCRIPDQNWGDLKAMIAALNTAEERLNKLCSENDAETIGVSAERILDYAETQAREAYQEIPDGEYVFWDYVEADHVDGYPIRIKNLVVVDGSSITLDYSGTEIQTASSFNLPSHSRDGHQNFGFVFMRYLKTVRDHVVFNHGVLRPITIEIPDRTVLNPEPGAAVGNRSALLPRIDDAHKGALASAIPEVIPAADAGIASIMILRTPNVETGGTKVTVVEPVVGGGGARPGQDGVDGVGGRLAALRNIPVESIENEAGIRVHRYRLRPDSGGPGRWRGGMGVEIRFELLESEATVISRAMDRYSFHPWGRAGGQPGATGYTIRNLDETAEDVGKIDVLSMGYGDTLEIGTPGGGGYGDPFERPPEAVQRDVDAGRVSVTSAESDYGVVIDEEGGIDHAATRERRTAETGSSTPAVDDISFGPRRQAYERVFDDEAQDTLNEELRQYPPTVATLLLDRIHQKIEEKYGFEPLTAERICSLVAQASTAIGIKPQRNQSDE